MEGSSTIFNESGFSPSPRESFRLPSPASAPCEVTPLTPSLQADWTAYADGHAEGTLFHGLGWRDAVRDTFGHEDLYLIARQRGKTVGVLPLFFVASRLAGRMLVSVPCAVGGGILADEEKIASELFAHAKRLATDRRCTMIDLRSERATLPDLQPVSRYVGFRRDLPAKAGDVLGWLPRKARAAARNGRNKYGLTVSFGDEHWGEVWRLYSLSMRRLGTLNYPRRFFERLLAGTPGRHWVSTVQWRGETVLGLITFLYRDMVMPYFIGATDEAKRCSAANFAYLTVMERGVEEGYRRFDFGRSRCDNSGSYDFKRFHGFEPRPLGYQVYLAPGTVSLSLSPDDSKFRLARKVWPHLPLFITRLAGAKLTKHIPG